MTDLDDLSRELTAEIEAHRVTREKLAELQTRQEAMERQRDEFAVEWRRSHNKSERLEVALASARSVIACQGEDISETYKDLQRLRGKIIDLVREVRAAMDDAGPGAARTYGIDAILDKYDGGNS